MLEYILLASGAVGTIWAGINILFYYHEKRRLLDYVSQMGRSRVVEETLEDDKYQVKFLGYGMINCLTGGVGERLATRRFLAGKFRDQEEEKQEQF